MQTLLARAAPRLLAALAGAVLLCGLAGCNNDDDDNETPPALEESTLSGTAAFGAPIVGGTVKARCTNGSGFNSAITTGANGRFSGKVAKAALPCALQISGGNLTANGYPALHSLATTGGNVNITPLTDLVLALSVNEAAGKKLAEWFADPSRLADVGAGLGNAQEKLQQALEDAGFRVPEDFDPLKAGFTPDPTTDAYDALLEALAEAIEESASHEDYKALLDAFTASSEPNLPPAPSGPDDGTVPATVHAGLVGSYSLVFRQGGGLGCGAACSFTEGQNVAVVVGTDNSLTIGGKTLTGPFNQTVGGSLNLHEIIWKDGDLGYALSDNQSGDFNEINVGKARASGGFDFRGQLRDETEAPTGPSNLSVLTAYAGTYTVLGKATGDTATRGTATRDHARGTITIQPDGGIDYDTGIAFSTAQIVEIFDRRNVAQDKRVAVNYGANDSAARIRIYFDTSGQDKPNITEIIYNDGLGSTTRAQIQEAPGPAEGLQMTVNSIDADTIVLTITGTLSGPDPTFDRNSLYLHAPGNWIDYPVDQNAIQVFDFAPTGSPVAGKTVGLVAAADSAQQQQGIKPLGDYIQINFGGTNLQVGDAGSGTTFTIQFPKNVIVTSALTSLSLSWGTLPSPVTYAVLQDTVEIGTVE